jgi:hypothetical protein
MGLDYTLKVVREALAQKGYTAKFMVWLREQSWALDVELRTYDQASQVIYDLEFHAPSPHGLENALLAWLMEVFEFNFDGIL